MSANVRPQFTQKANFASSALPAVAVTAANTSSEGGGTVGTSIFLLATAGASDSWVDSVVWWPTATTPTTTTATVARIFLSTVGTGTTTSANTFLIAEITLPAVSADSASAANNPLEFPLNERVPAGAFLLVTNHSAPAASTQWIARAKMQDY
jgi:hypothetical protein